ncbi:MAG: Ku protein [Bacillota bacterium]
MRPIWKGSIGFGLVVIPVKLYSATEKKDPKLRYVHAECGTPIRYKKWCPTCDREVSAQEIQWGFEVEDGRFVLITREEYAREWEDTPRRISITDFVDVSEVDPVYFDKPYFVEPADGAEKAYQLLRMAISDLGRVAVARFAARNRESLAVLRNYKQGVLLLQTMLWPDEVRSHQDIRAGTASDLSEKELEMAKALVNMMAGKFDPAAYKDARREYLWDLIRKKAEAHEVKQPVPEEAKVIDLLEALQKSVAIAASARGASARQERDRALGL